MKKFLMALVAVSLFVPAMARAQMFTATVTGQATGFISPGDQLDGEYGGIVYAGTLDGVTPLFVTRCDYGFTWNPDTNACEGTRSYIVWQTLPLTITGASSLTDGAANTAILAVRTDTPAARYCANLAPPDVNSHGYSDWYLPAKNEMNVIYTNRVAIGGFATSNYWTSSEYDTNNPWAMRFSDGIWLYQNSKNQPIFVRCSRKGN